MFGRAERNGRSAATTRRSGLGIVANRATASARPGWFETKRTGPRSGNESISSTSARRDILLVAQAPPAASPALPTMRS